MQTRFWLTLCFLMQILASLQARVYVKALIDPSDLNPFQGEKFQIRCSGKSNSSTIEVILFKDQKRIEFPNEILYDQKADLYRVNAFVYEISYLKPSDEGVYRCRATAGAYNDEETFALQIAKRTPKMTTSSRIISKTTASSTKKIITTKKSITSSNSSTCSNTAVFNCKSDEKLCKSRGICIPSRAICDGNNDCDDGSDESGCQKFQRALYQKSSFVNSISPMTATTKWQKINSTLGPKKTSTRTRNETTKWISISKKTTTKTTKVTKTTVASSTTKKVKTTKKSIKKSNKIFTSPTTSTTTTTTTTTTTIPLNLNKLSNYTGMRLLDTIDHTSCEPTQYKCGNKGDAQCKEKIWFCDGENDCPNGFDELECEPKTSFEMCDTTEVLCKYGTQCIKKGYVCDGSVDCIDWSDESGCIGPRITEHPKPNITICEGESFNLTCMAVGFPEPFINWRWNWAHVCTPPRCRMHKKNGLGIFTVQNALVNDSGAYSCEAINNRGRVFANDAIVTVLNCERSTSSSNGFKITTSTTMSKRLPPFSTSRSSTKSVITKKTPVITTTSKTTTSTTTITSTTTTSIASSSIIRKIPAKETDITRPSKRKLTFDCSSYGTARKTEDVCICNPEYTGPLCDECKNGSKKDTNGKCIPKIKKNFTEFSTTTSTSTKTIVKCNEKGTLHFFGSKCKCRPGYTGERCDQCDPNDAFKHPLTGECIICFCNGLKDVKCNSAFDWYYQKEKALYNEKWTILNDSGNKSSINGNSYASSQIYQYSGPSGNWFFDVPDTIKGNKITSYGGNISFIIYYDGTFDINNTSKLEVRLQGAKIALFYKHSELLEAKKEHRIEIPIIEKSFKTYPDERPLTRHHLLMALSDIEYLMIRATYVKQQKTSYIKNFEMDVAEPNNVTNGRISAYLVEKCGCPQDYDGTSCESCSMGYSKVNSGSYLGLCELNCDQLCNGHSKNCTKEQCYDCKHNTKGEFCHKCADGYFGDPSSSHGCYKFNLNKLKNLKNN